MVKKQAKSVPEKEKKNFILLLGLLLILVISLLVIQQVTKLVTKADELGVPPGFTVLEYMDEMERQDRNGDGVINALDGAMFIKHYGEPYVLSHHKFGAKRNSLELSFLISQLDVGVQSKRDTLFANSSLTQQYNNEIVRKNETTIAEPAYQSDPGFDMGAPLAVGEDGEAYLPEGSAETVSSEIVLADDSGSGSGSEEDFGRNVIPSVLGTVQTYAGSASFSYPFQLPAGPGGFGPSLSISYSSGSIDDARVQGSTNAEGYNEPYEAHENYTPFSVGYGFNLQGVGQIVRDTRKEKDVYKLKDDMHHRYILMLPSGLSVELKYNKDVGRWVSIPQGHLKIDHAPPEKVPDSKFDFKLLDPGQWIITSSDGTKYYFGEEDLVSKINPDAGIAGADTIVDKDGKTRGTRNGSIANEFDKADLCTGNSVEKPCGSREESGKPVLMVTKWLLKRVETPDGKTIDYTYQNDQKYLEYYTKKKWKNGIKWATVTSYLREITWNDEKHRVLVHREDRPDKGSKNVMEDRINKIEVQTKLQKDNQFHTVRTYDLLFVNDSSLVEPNHTNRDRSRNLFNSSLLASIKETGTDGTTSLPPVTFGYSQYRFPPQSPSGDSVYLSRIDNGYGGETSFAYQPMEYIAATQNGNFGGRIRRVRVIEKSVTDKTSSPHRSFKEQYNYHGSHKSYSDRVRGKHVSGHEFLGHRLVEVKQFDFDGTKLLGHTLTEFYQTHTAGTRERMTCMEPHPVKGSPKQSYMYNNGVVVSSTTNTYDYRVEGGEPQSTERECQREEIRQPYLILARDTIAEVNEAVPADFLPAGVADKLTVQPRSKIRTLQRNLEYDLYGNLTKSINYGEINESGHDVDTSDNRVSYTYYHTDGPTWIVSKPFLAYSSNSERCGQETHECQWGRSEMFYDNFSEFKWEHNPPTLGLLSQQVSYIDKNTFSVQGFDYHKLSSETGDERRGGVTRTWSPKPNIKTIDRNNVAGGVQLVSETKYDPYYHTLVTERKNTKGHTVRYEDYDYLLQVPQLVKAPTDDSPDRFMVTKMVFDPVGRLVRSHIPSPDNPQFAIGHPATLTHHFERGDEGLVVREMSLVSHDGDGYHYSGTDTFYDGLGQVKQAQVLRTRIEGTDRRTVSQALTNAGGQPIETYEVQTADPVIVNPNNSNNWSISSPAPSLVSVPRVAMSRTEYDTLNRPIATTQIEPNLGQELTTRTFFAVNGTKTVEPKGVQKLALSDVWGRAINSVTRDGEGGKILVTTNEYGTEMIDQPTKTIVSDGSESVESTFTYDRGGRLLTTSDPSLSSYSFEYDIGGNKIVEKSQPGEDVSFQYDELGRLKKRSYLALGENEMYNRTLRDSVEFTYDEGANALGQLSSVKHLTGEVSYEYDGIQRVVKTKRKVFDVEREFSTEFNDLSQELATNYPDNKVTYTYDREGNVQKVFLNGTELLSGVLYDKFGKKKESTVQFEGKTYTDKSTYDLLGRIQELTVNRQDVTNIGPVTTNILTQNLTYNPFAEIASLSERVGSASNNLSFAYDGFSQLTGVTSDLYNSSYAYDNFGRITNKNEAEQVTLSYNNTFPFFAPKSATFAGVQPPAPTEPSPPPVPPTMPPPPTTTTQPLPLPTVGSDPDTGIPTPAADNPTPTRSPAATRAPAPTIVPMATPRPTSRPVPTSTTAPGKPSPTPIPTNTPTPTPPPPTSTAAPTVPAAPTATRAPTPTPVATATPTPLPEPYPGTCMDPNNPGQAHPTRSGDGGYYAKAFVRLCNNPEAGCTDWDVLSDLDGSTKYGIVNEADEENYQANKPNGSFNASQYVPDGEEGVGEHIIRFDRFPAQSGDALFQKVKLIYDTDKWQIVKREATGYNAPTAEAVAGNANRIIGDFKVDCGTNVTYGWYLVDKTTQTAGFSLLATDEEGRPTSYSQNFTYTKEGALMEDANNCYYYNREGELSSLKVKETVGEACSAGNFVKVFYFFYNHEGTLVLEEQHLNESGSKPSKATYYFGPYEEVHE